MRPGLTLDSGEFVPADDLNAALVEAQQPAPSAADTTTVPEGWTDADADAARLALELECLLTDTKDQAVVSKWWASAHDALELHRARLASPQPSPTPQADSQPAPQGETNAQLDTDSNSPTPGQQRDVAGSVALGQPVGNGEDQAASHLGAQGDKLLIVAERNIRSFLRSAVFKSESDREAALNCVDVLWEAASAPADSQPAPQGEPWYGHHFKEVRRGYWQCSCGKVISEAASTASKSCYPPLPRRHTYGDDGEELFTADQMRAYVDAASAPADSQPAPVLDRDRIREIFMAHGFTVKEGQTDLKQYVYDAADALLRAASAPADSGAAPAGGAVSAPVFAFRRKGLDDFCTCTEERYAELSAKPNLFETRIFYTTPPAQAADSVLEDAARWQMLPAFFEEYQIDAMKLYRDIDAAIAARKQGANHD